MIWMGIAIGMVISFLLFTVAIIIVPKQKNQLMPDQLVKFWESSLLNQRSQFHAIASIADALEERNVQPNIGQLVDRFLAWPLPKDFSPDGGISFKNEKDARGYAPAWPVGTNLFTADQARQMLEYLFES
jgi:hypothetical protein